MCICVLLLGHRGVGESRVYFMSKPRIKSVRVRVSFGLGVAGNLSFVYDCIPGRLGGFV